MADRLSWRLRLPGFLLFLPVPLVLFLLTRLPLGPVPSLALGLVLMGTHGLYARPFALSRARERCLYCGGAGSGGPLLKVKEPFGETVWACCSEGHARLMGGVLTFSAAHRFALRLAILGGTLLLVVGEGLAGAGRLGPAATSDVAALFRVVIALAVLPLSLLGPGRVVAEGVPSVPFPLHVQALLGTLWVLWLFRIVGVWWLVWGVAHFVQRLLPGFP